MLETVEVSHNAMRLIYLKELKETIMWTKPTYQKVMWTQPTYQKVRLGFEITMYYKQN